MERLPDLEQLVAFVDAPDRDPLELLTDAVILSGRLGELGDDLIDHFVHAARESGASWADIGQAIGVSKQAAQKRFVRRPPGFRGARRGLFTRFAAEARSTVKKAVEVAQHLGSEEIGTLHLVVALTDVAGGGASDALHGIGCDVEAIHNGALEALGGPSEDAPISGHIPFAADSKKVLELSLREAIHGESRHIGTEHILLGVLRDGDSEGARLLTEHGVTSRAVRSWIEERPAPE